MFKFFSVRRLKYVSIISAVGIFVYTQNTSLAKMNSHDRLENKKMELPILPNRDEMLKKVKSEPMFDVFIIGGGSAGCGVAVDGSIKGLNVALVDRGDFGDGTSSKSTKLLHGGVRYLQNAIFKFDLNEYHLVKEALHERKRVMENCPYLTNPIPIMIPIYSWWKVPYYWAGLKIYDLVAGSQFFRSSYLLSKDKTIDEFPLIKTNNLQGSIVYYDGQMDDSRLNLMLAMTSIEYGALCLNYVEVIDLIKHKDYIQIRCKDSTNGVTFDCNARVVINATGPFTDNIRKLYDKNLTEICHGSAGTHIILPRCFGPKSMGVLDANTSDDRVLFMLPWNGYILAGTTDNKCSITKNPKPTQEEIDFIIKEINTFLNPAIRIQTSDILSAWAGIRPLVVDIHKQTTNKETSTISRNHVIEKNNNFITIAGGKWTTYRAMAEDTMKYVIKSLETLNIPLSTNRNIKKSTVNVKLYGSEQWTPYYYISIIQDYRIAEDIAKHLSSKYGMCAQTILEMAKKDDGNVELTRIDNKFPYTIEEIRYCCRYEYVNTAVDMIARRIRLSFLDSRYAKLLLEKIVCIMAIELNWSTERANIELKNAESYIKEDSGLDLIEKQQKY